jgi:hypothetical protein
MRLNEDEVNDYLRNHLGQYEDSFQQAWLEVVERDPQTIEEIPLIVRKIKNRAIKQYLTKKFREKVYTNPLGRMGMEALLLNQYSRARHTRYPKTMMMSAGGCAIRL